jgi:hypothetical protein
MQVRATCSANFLLQRLSDLSSRFFPESSALIRISYTSKSLLKWAYTYGRIHASLRMSVICRGRGGEYDIYESTGKIENKEQ